MSRDDIMAKVRKLLNLAKDAAASEQEAITAAEKAHSLMAEHALTISEVAQDLAPHVNKWERVHTRIIPSVPRFFWHRYIFDAVSELYFCHYYVDASKSHFINGDMFYGVLHHITGTPEYTEVAGSMAQYLVRTVHRLADESKARGRTGRNSFMVGCAARLAERLRDRKKQSELGRVRTDEGLKLPALLGQYEASQNAIDQYYLGKGMKFHTGRTRKSSLDSGAYHAGRAAGDRINIGDQLPGKRSTPALPS